MKKNSLSVYFLMTAIVSYVTKAHLIKKTVSLGIFFEGAIA